MHEFDGDTWKFKALEDYVAYKELDEFVHNDLATQAHVNSYRLSTTDADAFPKTCTDTICDRKILTLRDALTHFARQTTVSLCTTYEVTVRDFFKTYFQTNPAALFEYVGPEDAKGYVALRDILQVESHTELIVRLADRAAGAASKGKYGQVYARAFALCGVPEDKELLQRLNSLQVERNKFIHERHRPDCGLNEVTEAHSIVDGAIEGLCELGVAKGIPGRYTCIRPTMRLIAKDIAFVIKKDI